ncbi:hypothetical protein [Maribacter sp. 2304DJ31-5]|uniref:hypothetical protein n=1 Tax=Maribacter sp. 2304DJ31-5 TaxID=3386273 RepID=UPI0039BCC63E
MDKNITSIKIDANNCFEVFLDTRSKTDEISIEGKIDGEYKKDLKLNIVKDGNSVWVNAGFRPNFKNPNDKLSAHKVISIALRITVPEWKWVSLYGTRSRVLAQGKYKKLNIALSEGSCELKEVAQQVNVRTQSGDILVNAIAAQINARTKYGTQDKNTIPKGHNRYTLNTVTGNIILNKTE